MWVQIDKETKKVKGYIEQCIGVPVVEEDCELIETDSLIPENWMYCKYIDGVFELDEEYMALTIEEDNLNEIRLQREIECFPIINRGALWYSKLTEEQMAELDVWYQAWLDATETKVIPQMLEWIK